MALSLPDQPASTFVARRRALATALADTPAVVFTAGPRARNYPANVYPYRGDSHFIYLTGAAIPRGALLLADGRSELFVDPPPPNDALWHGETPSFARIQAALGVDAIQPWEAFPEAVSRAGGGARIGTLPSVDPVVRQLQARRLGREWGDVSATPELTEVDERLADAIIGLRLVHDDAAIAMLRRAAEGTAAAHLAGMALTRPGLREHDIRAAMEGELLARGMEPAYGSIVSVHGEVLHSNVYDNVLENGHLLLADVGAECDGWAGDVTRTWPVSGKFSPSQRDLYQLVYEAEVLGVSMVRARTRYRDIHLAVSRRLTQGLVDVGILRGNPDSLVERGAHALFFPHGVGHLLGLDVHDMEDLGDRAGYAPGRTRSTQFGLGYLRLDRDLEPGMAVTIEPGIYFVPAILRDRELCGPFDADGTLVREALARFSDVRGIRIEDDVLCTRGEPEVLSAAIPKSIAGVEAAVTDDEE